MQHFIGTSRLLLVLLLQLVPAQMLHLPEQRQSNPVAFMEVLKRSMCRPMEQLVDVEHEFPEDVEYIYIPACVPLWRCSGCCADEKLECRPTTKRNITLQVMRILPLVSMQHVELTFVEHQECDCRLSQKPQNNKSSSESVRSRPRRRKHKKPDVGCGNDSGEENSLLTGGNQGAAVPGRAVNFSFGVKRTGKRA